MPLNALSRAGGLALALILPVAAPADQILIDETFTGSTVPDGWVFSGKEGTSHTSPWNGADKTDADWFTSPGTDGFLRLTENSWNQRTTAIYGADTFSTKFDFSISAEVRITSGSGTVGADGMSFFWLDADSLDLDTYDLSHYQGGMGEWQGAPRGTDVGPKTPDNMETQFGAYNSPDGFWSNRTGESLRGYSFEFDHYQNAQQEQEEYNHMVRLDDWAHMTDMRISFTNDASSPDYDPNYYEDVGWVSFELAYSAADKNFTYTYTGRDGDGNPVASKTVVLTPTAEEWTEFDQAYFGISAATGGQTADHDIRNLVIAQAPGPGTLALFAFAPLLLRRRHRPRHR